MDRASTSRRLRYPATPRAAGRTLAVIVAIVALAAAVRTFWPGAQPAGARVELRELATALGREHARPIAGRLTGGFDYAPPPPTYRGSRDAEVSPGLLIAAARIEESAGNAETARMDAALGVAALSIGHVGRAVAALERASGREPGESDWLSDLSAAYLASATAQRRHEDLPKALDCAARAVRLSPRSMAAQFNYALALEHAGLSAAALAAWRTVVAAEPDSRWKAEAVQHVETLAAAPAPAQSHTADTARWRIDDRDGAVAAVHGSYKTAREAVLDSLLPQWGSALIERRDRDAADRLRRAGLLADALASSGGDRTAADIVASIRRADVRAANGLARMLVAYGRGRALEIAAERQAARPFYQTAERLGRALGSPLWGWCAMALATSASDAHALDAADRALTPAAALAAERGLSALAGEVQWVQGNVLGERSRFVEALLAFEHGLDSYRRAGEVENVASMHTQLAYMHRLLGNPQAEWEQRVVSLSLLPKIEEAKRRYLILFGAGTSAFEGGHAEAALQFESAAAAEALAAGDPLSSAQALASRARIRHALGEVVQAQSDIAEARRFGAAVRDPVLRKALEARVRLNEIDLAVDGDPARSAEAFAGALRYFRDRQRDDFLPLLYLARGQALVRQGQRQPALAAFDEGIRVFERRRRALESDKRGLSFFDRSWSLFAEQLQVLLADPATQHTALAYAERLHGVSGDSGAPAIAAALPDDTVLLYYVVLPDHLVAWKLSKGRTASLVKLAATAEVEASADRLVSLVISDRSREKTDAAAAKLFDLLLRPLLDGVAPETRLVIVPDGVLYRVPFALLRNSRTGRYVVEDHAVAIAPSAAGFLEASRRLARARDNHAPALLVVGGALVDRRAFPGLPYLPGSRDEARQIATQYDRPEILTDVSATKTRFLELLPESDIVHVSGHAVVNPALPGMSLLLFTPEPGRNGGELFAHELRSRPLPRTELVVLAGCETAIGPVSHADGALSLARPFLLDGAATVVATLWRIDDAASAVVFDRFHDEYRRVRDAATALRRTQVALLGSDPAFRNSPWRWAGIQAIGGVTGVCPKEQCS